MIKSEHTLIVLLYCCLILYFNLIFLCIIVGTYCFVQLPVNNGVIDKVQQKSIQSQFHCAVHKVNWRLFVKLINILP